jgi:predicted AAA+ superfamily ATPase
MAVELWCMELIIQKYNSWWKTSQVDNDLKGTQRDETASILKDIKIRQILLISGLRRAGKTTVLYQLIDHLISEEKESPTNILYFSFDERNITLDELLSYFEIKILKKPLSECKQKLYFFLDEIQKLKDWQNKIKILYDLYPNLKIILSGSANITMKQGASESLAGRFFHYNLEPLSFLQFLKFKKLQIGITNEQLYRTELISGIDDYLSCGGFIESFNFSKERRKKYFKESLIERIIYQDIPDVFRVDNRELLIRLLAIFAEYPGYYLDYKNIGIDLGYDQRTIKQYINYLEYGLLTKRLYNYSTNKLTSEKKTRRIYLSNVAFNYGLSLREVSLSKMLEQFFIQEYHPAFYFRSPQKEEIDMVIVKDKKLIPIEVKIRRTILSRDLSAIIKFCKKFDVEKCYVITLDTHEVIEKNEIKIALIPYWKVFTLNDEFK